MTVFTGIVVYLLIWWTALFAVLPWGVRRDLSGPETVAHGAPENPRLKEKFIITTLISAVLWIGVHAAVESDIISFRDMARNMMEEDTKP